MRLLRDYFDLGFHYMILTHTNSNHWADSSGDPKQPNSGLSPLRKEIVAEMNRRGMFVDMQGSDLRIAVVMPRDLAGAAQHAGRDDKEVCRRSAGIAEGVCGSAGVESVGLGSDFDGIRCAAEERCWKRATPRKRFGGFTATIP